MTDVFERIAARTIEGPTVREELGPCLDSTLTPSHRYPSIKANQQMFTISRLVLESTLGRPIRDGYQACHRCDRSRCIRAEHLYEGTPEQNARDMVERGRCAMSRPEVAARASATRIRKGTHRGSRNNMAVLSENDISTIRNLYEHGRTQLSIAQQFGVAFQTISKIVRGERWAHVSSRPAAREAA